MGTTSRITPSCQYGLTDTVWRGAEVAPTAGVNHQRNIFGGPATIYSLTFTTDSGAAAFDYIKLYDGLSAKDGSGNFNPPTLIIPIGDQRRAVLNFPSGLPFTTGVTVRATSDVAEGGTTAPVGNIYITITARK